jgi:Flp pilus assembly protein TadD
MLRAAQSRPQEAEQEFRNTMALSPGYALPHFHLGRLLARAGKQAEARTELEKALALQPELPEAYYELGLLLRKLGENEKAAEAMAHFQKFREAESSERALILKQLQETVR